MNTTASPITVDTVPILGDDCRPRFLDDEFTAHADALADWWLDLGRVDLPTATR